MANTRLSPHFILQNVYDPTTGKLKMDGAVTLSGTGNIINVDFDAYTLEYITSGNGTGEVGVIKYRVGGKTGTIVLVLTYEYDANNRIVSVERS